MGFFDKFKRKSDNVNNNQNNSPDDKTNKGFEFFDKLIHSGVKKIVLDYDIELISTRFTKEEKKYSNGILLDIDDMVIDGNGHSIDAKGKSRIFICTGKNITIKNITLKNGFAMPDHGGNVNGGAIEIDGGSLHIYNSHLSNNVANKGGAIFKGGHSELDIVDSTFSNNLANDGDGGAISVPLGVLNVNGSTFSNNIAKNYGGAIYITNANFKIQKCMFSDNKAEYGGAVSDYGRIPFIPAPIIYEDVSNINESIFSNNAAVNEGGAIHSRDELNINDSKLISNDSSEGAAIYSQGHTKVLNCIISNNKSQADIIINHDSLQIFGSEFKDNKSDNLIYNKSNLTVFNCKFLGNDVDDAVIFNSDNYCTIEKSIFENNLFNENSKNIFNNGDLTLINPKIKDECKSVFNDEYIFIKQQSPNLLSQICGDGVVEVDMDIIPDDDKFDFGYLDKKIHENPTNEIILESDICLENYEKEFYEGGIDLDIDDLVIDGNGKTIDGANKSRIFVITGKNITLKNIIFKNGQSYQNYDNKLNNHGGALRINQGANLTIINCKFIDNKSDKYGAAISNRGVLNISKSNLCNHKTDTHGGFIYNVYGVLKIFESMISHNTAKWKGGAIYNRYGNLTISKSTLSDNSVGGVSPGGFSECGFGGAIYNQEGNLIISECILSSNIAKSDGGAIYNDEGDLTIIGSTFIENATDSTNSGAICTREKGLDKVFDFITNEIGPRGVSIFKAFNAEELKNNVLKYANIKDCNFKCNDDYDISTEIIDVESEYLKNYNLNEILGFNY